MIKKYQNSGTINYGTKISPEREAEIRAEQQAALDDLWRQRNAYAKQEEQERKQQLKEEIKRVTAEHAAKTAHLDNGSSATDWYYALQDDPQKRAEWDRGAKLTTLAGLGAIATPYLLYGMGSMGGAIYRGLNNPITRTAVQQAGTKAGISTLLGTAIDQGSYDARTAIGTSSIGDSKLNKYAINPILVATPFLLDPGKAVERRLATGVTDMASDVLRHTNLPTGTGRRPHTELGQFLKRTVQNLAGKQDDVLIETFPVRPEYVETLSDDARRLYEEGVRTGDALIGNGTYLGLSGKEIARRELGKQAGFGNDGNVLLRAAGIDTFRTPPKSELYTFVANPGIADKYAISLKKGTTFPGYFTSGDLELFNKQLQQIDDRIKIVKGQLERSIQDNNRSGIIENLRELDMLYRRRPSDIQVYNANVGTLSKYDPNTDLASEVGRQLRQQQMMQRSGGPSAIRAGEIGMDLGLERFIVNESGNNLVEPLIYKDGLDIIQTPMLKTVNATSSQSIPMSDFIEQMAESYPHLRSYLHDSAKKFGIKVAYPDQISKMLRGVKSPKTYNDSAITQAFMGYVPDSTAGLGPVPTVTFVGQSPGLVKGIGPMSSGQFFNVPSILKQGGNIPNYFRLLKNK